QVDRDAQTSAAGIPAAPAPPEVDRDARTFDGSLEPPLAGVDPGAQTFVGAPPPPAGPSDLESTLNQSGPLTLPDFPEESTFGDGGFDPRGARTISDSTASRPAAFDSRASGFGSQASEAWSLSGSHSSSGPPPTAGVPPTQRQPPPSAGTGETTRLDHATRADPSKLAPQAGPGDTQVEPRSAIDQGSALVQSQATIPRGKPGSAIPSRLGPYRLLKALGAGGMGAVYEAVHLRTDRKIALKVLRAPPGADTGVQRFLVEGRAAGRLAHPNLVSVLDLAQDERSELWYMAMELVEGETLYELVDREGPLDDRRAAEVGVALADALSYAHGEKVLHRDVKPHNVMLDKQGTVRLTDFGLAKLLEEPGQALTQGFTLLGTPGYMPPEQAGMAAPVDARADVYGVGATLYYSLTGKSPFTGKTVGSVIHQVLSKSPAPLRKTRPEIHADLETIVLHCLEKQVEHRYPTMQDLAEDLRRFLADTAIVAKRPSLPEQFKRWARLNPKPALLGALAICLVLMGVTYGGLAFVTRARHQAELERQQAEVEKNKQKVVEEREQVSTEREQTAEERAALEAEQARIAKQPPTLELRTPELPKDGSPLRTRADSLEVAVRAQDRDLVGVTLDGVALTARDDADGVYVGRWSLPGEGRHEATLEAKDEAGNVTAQTLRAVRDVRPPRLEVAIERTKYPEGDPDAATEVEVRVTVHDEAEPALAKVQLTRRVGEASFACGDPIRDGDHTWVWSEVQLGLSGTHVFAATATDDVGNEGAAEAELVTKQPKVVERTWWNALPSQKQFALERNLPLTREVRGIPFVLIPPGVYSRGANENDPFSKQGDPDARPHVVRLTRGFYLSAWEISQAQYQQLMLDYSPPDFTPHEGRAGLDEPPTFSLSGLQLPAVGVGRVDASTYCAKLGEAAGLPGKLRLPTEAEWEYACRAETTGVWFWGGATYKAREHANVKDDDYKGELAPNLNGPGTAYFNCSDGFLLLAPVGRSGVTPNPFGLYDMIGNAEEWVRDGFSNYPLDRSAELTDPFSAGGQAGITRGGSFCSPLKDARPSARNAHNLSKALSDVGFRVLLELDE
ncbi:MAG: SUMF1/EgtB/PvdO family nonheme iron enzyme, partial [Planctomycetes bacterium]|nr:SUMF1/EgtB/PvdO family nonheme iron enzyme [Planctomycetota bacterium]